MTTRIFLFHPDMKGQSRVNKALAEAAVQAGFEVRDLYALYPDFQVDAKAEQAILEETDRIVLQFPMYWYSSPALLKQWEDVFWNMAGLMAQQGTLFRTRRFSSH